MGLLKRTSEIAAAAARRLLGRSRALPAELSWEIRDKAAPVLAVVRPDWYGVTTSARNNFPNVLLCPPDHEPLSAVQQILDNSPSAVVFSDMSELFAEIARTVKRRSPATRLIAHYHASFAQNAEAAIRERFKLLVALTREGVIDRAGCAKAGMAEVLDGMGVPACYVPNRAEPPGTVAHHPARSPRRIGVFVKDIPRKNAHTQFMAARMMDNVEIHTNEGPDLSYLPEALPLFAHGQLPYREFLKLAGDMDLNLYVSLSECYPMVVVESLIRGVPCLTSHTHEIFQHHPALGRALIVGALDNPAAIAEQAERVLADREALGRQCEACAHELNRRAEALINEFVGFELYPAGPGPSTRRTNGLNEDRQA